MSIPYAIERVLARRRTPRWERVAIPLAILAGVALASNLLWWSGWRINLTESEPLGFYRLFPVEPTTAIRPGERIEFCPPPSVTPARFPFYMKGDCPGGGMPMFKQVVGVPGDRITVTLQGVTINGRALSYSGQLTRSGTWPWLRLPHQLGTFTLGPDQYWVYGSGAKPALAAQSFDSRYWGPVERAEIRRIVG